MANAYGPVAKGRHGTPLFTRSLDGSQAKPKECHCLTLTPNGSTK
ncbi:hypothetical protein [Acinetobacter baumannii]